MAAMMNVWVGMGVGLLLREESIGTILGDVQTELSHSDCPVKGFTSSRSSHEVEHFLLSCYYCVELDTPYGRQITEPIAYAHEEMRFGKNRDSSLVQMMTK